ncbi:UspA domain protein [Thermocrinis albus DSM 14484]|uniref:UspA domain protein n=1 Tax=Thermocrinis albus (strain DSM 14484 / JCM 11386 / HI 11/12) TaxID=638303 RepID=D3SLR5_THEAH|nr:universal stress protein [Thermocrinis albus]ADC89695.1 UspA domain protein [Thermocrinis albus DSM 14484]
MKILVPVDFSEVTNPLLRLAKSLANLHSAEVILMHAVAPVMLFPYPESFGLNTVDLEILSQMEQEKIKNAREKLAALVEFMKPVKTDLYITVGDPAEAIIEKEREVDLVIMASHRKGLVERILLGSTAQKVVRYSTKPVLVFKGEDRETFHKVCVAYDFSQLAREAFFFALDLIAFTPVEFLLLHVEESINLPIMERIVTDIEERIKEEKRKHLQSMVEEAKKRGIKASYEIGEHHHVAVAILEKSAQWGADLLVMGSRGLTGLKRVIVGSTSEEVIRKAEMPVLIYRNPS